MTVGADSDHFVRFVWHVDHTQVFGSLVVEILIEIPLLLLQRMRIQIVEINSSIARARHESHIVLEPVDAVDPLHVAGVHHAVGAVVGVEVVDVDVLVAHSGEHVPAMRELDIVAVTGRPDFIGAQLISVQVHQLDFILQRDDQMQSTGMERDSQALFRCGGRLDLEAALGHIPNVDGLVFGAGGDQLLPDADVEAGDFLAVERSNKIIEREAVLGVLLEAGDVNVAVNQLSLLGHDINLVFLARHSNTHDVVVAFVGESLLGRHLNSCAISDAAQRHSIIIIIVCLRVVKEEIVGDSHDDTLSVGVDALDVLS